MLAKSLCHLPQILEKQYLCDCKHIITFIFESATLSLSRTDESKQVTAGVCIDLEMNEWSQLSIAAMAVRQG